MKNSIFIFCVLWVFSALCGVSCKRTENHLILTFDDANVDEWFAQREMFDKYNIRVTFFVTRPHQLSEEQIEKLRILQTEGHEVGCHGLNHIQATEENQYQYIETEIKPALKILSELGFTVTSFAYPFGASTPCLDSMLTHYFSFIRKATYNYRDTLISSYPEIYIEKKIYVKRILLPVLWELI
jgi:peptidoglycan/xylan/chitin deacetylase (PgdA/CDA1 family)